MRKKAILRYTCKFFSFYGVRFHGMHPLAFSCNTHNDLDLVDIVFFCFVFLFFVFFFVSQFIIVPIKAHEDALSTCTTVTRIESISEVLLEERQ